MRWWLGQPWKVQWRLYSGLAVLLCGVGSVLLFLGWGIYRAIDGLITEPASFVICCLGAILFAVARRIEWLRRK
jgi:hypothetical protein